MLRRAWLAGALGLLLQAKAWACGSADLQALLESAQSLAPDTEVKGRPLLSCPQEVAEASHWLAFYRQVSASKAVLPRGVAAKNEAPGEVGQSIVLAYSGYQQNLQTKLDSGDPRYTDTPEVYLALARMAVQNHQFSRGRSDYQTYLRLKGSVYPVEAELLYSWIWEGRYDQAQHELATVDVNGTPPSFAQAVGRGRELVQRLHPAPASAGPAQGAPEFGLDLEGLLLRNQMDRVTSSLHYHGWFDAAWQHHAINELIYDKAMVMTDQFMLGSEHTIEKRVALSAHVGYLVSAKDHYLGDAEARLRIKNQLWVSVGADRQALLTQIPLATSSLGLVEDRAFIEAGWPGELTWRSALLRDLNLAPFERHQLDVRRALKSAAAGVDTLSLVGQAFYEARPQPSPDYDTYQNTVRLGAGVAFAEAVGSEWNAAAEAVYFLSLVKERGATSGERLSGAKLSGQLSSRLSRDWLVVGKLAYSIGETDRPVANLDHQFTASAGLEYRP